MSRFADHAQGAIVSAPEPIELSLVICTLDEEDSIGRVLTEVGAVLEGERFEIIVVDDSTDERTAEIVRTKAAADGRIRLIRRPETQGLAGAAIAGWDAARGVWLAVMDGDGQHDPARLRDLLEAIHRTGADVAVASRYIHRGPTGLGSGRHLLSRLGTTLTKIILGVKVADPLSGFFMMRLDWYQTVRPKLSGVGFKILVDCLTSGPRVPRIVETPTQLRSRIGGNSKLDARVMVDLAALLLEKRTGGLAPARFVLFVMVGATGVAIHLLALIALSVLARPPFWLAQAGATLTAMTTNFFLNNALTFRDRRLQGRRLLQGLGLFYLACSGGAILAEALGVMLQRMGMPWLLAGFFGAMTAATVNYMLSRRFAWGLQVR